MTQQILLGKGMYSYPRAAQLTGVQTQSLRAWTHGRTAARGPLTALPVVTPELPDVDSEHALSFLNLVEVHLLGEFRRLGLSLQYIRRAVEVLRQSYDMDHPLACRRLLTDGQSIFAEIDENGEFACIEIAGRQPNHAVLEDVIRPFFKDLDFLEETELAHRWFPQGRSVGIVLDPGRAFGEPILVDSGVRTATLASLLAAGDDVDAIASWYEVTSADVANAARFENALRDRRAA